MAATVLNTTFLSNLIHNRKMGTGLLGISGRKILSRHPPVAFLSDIIDLNWSHVYLLTINNKNKMV
jgi:hypothetical protein